MDDDGSRAHQVEHVLLDCLTAMDYDEVGDAQTTVAAIELALSRLNDVGALTTEYEEQGNDVSVIVNAQPLVNASLSLIYLLVLRVMQLSPEQDEHDVIAWLRGRVNDAEDEE